ncbi:hypothetical protein AKJ09_09208 [Labilithrix luteola]|uniref:Uncharacterized protein n=1 Tax=Labilithrix luteola TaxID=1391654 RepID=A0A0K1QAU7_9BACT|nr:hypothetical protein AKJ09_09208 [Labilithrix luteola]
MTLKKTYGVPRSVSVAHAVEVTGRGARGPRAGAATPAARRGAAGRAARSVGKEAEVRDEMPSERPRGGRKPAHGSGPATKRGDDKAAPRFGGASSGRRGFERSEDRGSNRGRRPGGETTREERPAFGGARSGGSGRTRTPGGAGTSSTGARGPAERAKGRRGR